MPEAATPVLSESSTVFNILSPKGHIEFPYLAKPDTHFDRFGYWKVLLNVSASDANPLLKAVDFGVTQALKDRDPNTERAALPYKQEHDGSYTFTIKAKAWPQATRPRVFGVSGFPVSPSLVCHGSLARVRFVLIPFCGPRTGAGVTLRLQEVHLVEESR